MAILAGFLAELGENTVYIVWILFSGLGFVAAVCSILIEEDLRKTNYNDSKVQHIATDRGKEVEVFDEEEFTDSEYGDEGTLDDDQSSERASQRISKQIEKVSEHISQPV